MTGAKTTAGKGVLQMTMVVADILPLVAEPWADLVDIPQN
jgi:hypothetical protein